MNWVTFSDEHRLRFFDLIMKLNRERFIQLSDYEKSLFYHYWHKILNEHTCWLLEMDGKDMAFVSHPTWQAKHWMRWPENLLLLDQELHELPLLPDKMKDESSFRTGYSAFLSKSTTRIVTVDQIAYTLNLKRFVPLDNDYKAADIEYLHLGTRHTGEIQELLSELEEHIAPYYHNELKRMIANNSRAQYGFGYYGILKEMNLPIAVVFYEAFEMPLTGTPCMLVSDIFVKKQYRDQGIATQLQHFAYTDMKSKGINWIIGNIDAENSASVKQALKLGRTPWALQITLTV
jgi:GNAT superfamily N-acetyltransferase